MNKLRSTIIDRVNILKGNMNQKDFGEIIGCGQSKVSELLNGQGNREFNINEIVKISAYFGVSTDYVLGLTDERTPRTSPKGSRITPRQFCEMLVNMKDKQNYSMHVKKISTKETRAYFYDDDIKQEPITSDYIALYFSNYDGDGNYYICDDENGAPIYEQAPNFQKEEHSINTFLEHWQRIRAAYVGGSIDKTDYEYLTQKRLSEVME